jgi:TPP-dependent 2-oxoacid decarboxylase
MSSISAQNFSSIDDDHKEISLSKETETDFKTEIETSDAWISLNTDPNDMKFLSHIYSYMIYKIIKLQIQKSSNKGDMTKKPDLAQSLQKLITLTKHILFF